MIIGYLGWGEAARAFAATLTQPGDVVLAHDIKLAGPERALMRDAMTAAGATICDHAADLAQADIIFSAVTADQSLLALQLLLPALHPGVTVIDINSVSPGRKRETAVQVVATGAAYLDMAVMAPVHPRGHRTPVLVAGPGMDDFMTERGFDWRRVGDAAGAATAIKMVRSVFVKGLEAITVECLLAAERSGCRDEIIASLAASYPGLGWPGHAEYVFDRTLIHGTRRAAEMRESAVTLAELGLTGALADAIADVQQAQGRAGRPALVSDDLTATLAATTLARSAADQSDKTAVQKSVST